MKEMIESLVPMLVHHVCPNNLLHTFRELDMLLGDGTLRHPEMQSNSTHNQLDEVKEKTTW